jgi:hypothetical protein
VVDIMKDNQEAPLKLADMFRSHMGVLDVDGEAYAASLMAKERPLSLEELEAILESYRHQAEDVHLMCADTVRTGAYSYALCN